MYCSSVDRPMAGGLVGVPGTVGGVGRRAWLGQLDGIGSTVAGSLQSGIGGGAQAPLFAVILSP